MVLHYQTYIIKKYNNEVKRKGKFLFWIGGAVSMLVDPQGAVIIDTQSLKQPSQCDHEVSPRMRQEKDLKQPSMAYVGG
jgi:hypothetical protein